MVVTDPPTEAGTIDIVEACRRLSQGFQQHPDIPADLEKIISTELAIPLGDDTYGSLGRRLSDYLGDPDTATFLLNSLTVVDLEAAWTTAGLKEEIEEFDVLVRALSFLRALYKERLQKAQAAWREMPDDWNAILTELQFDAIAGVWKYGIVLEKYNGDLVTVRGPATSLINLSVHLLKLIQRLPDTNVVVHDRLIELIDEVKGFDTWAASAEADQDEATAPEEGDGSKDPPQ